MEPIAHRAIRAETDFPVVEHAGRFTFWVRGVNISTTGCLLHRGDLPMRDDQLVELELHLPKKSFRVMASTVWTNGSLEGLKFLGLDDADRLSLAEALDAACSEGAALH